MAFTSPRLVSETTLDRAESVAVCRLTPKNPTTFTEYKEIVDEEVVTIDITPKYHGQLITHRPSRTGANIEFFVAVEVDDVISWKSVEIYTAAIDSNTGQPWDPNA